MNYIKLLELRNKQLEEKISEAHDLTVDLMVYYSLPKFQGTQNDYAHVSTDVLPKLTQIKTILS